MNRMLVIAWCVVAAGGSTAQAKTMSAACAARDLQVVALIEQRGEAGDLPAAKLGELGLMQLQARLTCIAGEEARALALYDDILVTSRPTGRVGS